MEDNLDDPMNASQMLHLALQKMDDIIANNPDLESLSAKSDLVLSSEDVHFDPQSPSYKKQCNNFKYINSGNNTTNGSVDGSPNKITNGNKKHDKLNRLLQELKDYSQDNYACFDKKNCNGDNNLDINLMKPTKHCVMENDKQNIAHLSKQNRYKSYSDQEAASSNNNNNGSNISSTTTLPGANQVSGSDNVDKPSPQSQLDKSTSSTPEYYRRSPELGDALVEHDRNSNYLHQFGLTNESQYQENCQAERIAQLESIVNILRNQQLNTEDLFKKALLSKKALEGANCDLLTVVDKLKLDLTHSDGRRKLIEEHNVRIEADIESLKNRLLEKETEISSLRLTLAKIVRTTGYVLSDNELALLRGKAIASDYFIKNKLIKETYPDGLGKQPSSKSNAFYSEPSSRRDSFSSNACGRSSPVMPARFHSAHPSPSSTPPARASNANNNGFSSAANPTMIRSTSAEDMKVHCEHSGPVLDSQARARSEHKQAGRFTTNLYSTLPHNSRALKQIQKQLEESERQTEQDTRKRYANDEIRQMSQSLMDQQLNSKALSTPSSPVTFKSSMHTTSNLPAPTAGVTFAKDDEIIPPSLQSSTSELNRNGIAPPRILINDSKPKGFKKIFSRKRSTSSLSGLSDAFSRGGLRATSGPRLGFSNNNEKKFENIKLAFSQWDTTLVADWFAVIGLGMYVSECKRWCKNGEHLMRATSAEVEKDLGIRNMLHRKKLRLAVAAMNDEEDQLLKNAGKLDYLWVARWLDDIGLPQYKDAFLDARIDGRVLHYLTVEDLFYLKITSQLHFASIRSGIRILRENNYNSQCLKRRAAPEDNEQSESEVALWSSHRVMEWLRSIDLSEYAPNLRGSGVHGALILLENAFNADLFATLLSIPTNKTLLRRHISAKFKQLIGDELSKTKRDYECQPNYTPMIPGSKVKAYKKGHFTLRKKRSDYELSDYVCPMSPVLSTRSKIISMIQESKSLSASNSQVNQPSTDTNSIADWKGSTRLSSAGTKSVQSENNGNNLSDSAANNDVSKSATEMEISSENGIKKESLIT